MSGASSAVACASASFAAPGAFAAASAACASCAACAAVVAGSCAPAAARAARAPAGASGASGAAGCGGGQGRLPGQGGQGRARWWWPGRRWRSWPAGTGPRLEDVVTTLLASRDRRAAHWPASATREAIAAAVPTPAVIMISRPLEMSLPSTSAIASRTRPTDRLEPPLRPRQGRWTPRLPGPPPPTGPPHYRPGRTYTLSGPHEDRLSQAHGQRGRQVLAAGAQVLLDVCPGLGASGYRAGVTGQLAQPLPQRLKVVQRPAGTRAQRPLPSGSVASATASATVLRPLRASIDP